MNNKTKKTTSLSHNDIIIFMRIQKYEIKNKKKQLIILDNKVSQAHRNKKKNNLINE